MKTLCLILLTIFVAEIAVEWHIWKTARISLDERGYTARMLVDSLRGCEVVYQHCGIKIVPTNLEKNDE